ncbi:MAG: hypothetical protein SPI21_02125 [Hungatella hathewayi]|uniref:hypothetical protein n=1 Tax=Hungatella TaxID=1649459 RepID=UPI001105C3D9|nr:MULTISPECIES: hypothetical protein [Hungatella]MCI7380583.1 hypothetical protein [Hungatella sp.]MDY6235577.1 hypothetical protein [Hungatella hathewayi]
MKQYCIDEKQVELMKGGFQDVGKWVFYLLKAARTANIPWSVLQEGITKVGAYDAYALYPRTNDLKELAAAICESDMVKAYDGRIVSVDDYSMKLELCSNPMIEMAQSCTEDTAFLQELEDAYFCVFRGIFETYGLRCEIEKTSASECGCAVLTASRE